MRFIAGLVLFVLVVLATAVGVAAQRGVAAGFDDPDAPIAAGRPDEDALAAAMAYDPPAVQPSGRRLSEGVELLGGIPARMPRLIMAFAEHAPQAAPQSDFDTPARRRPGDDAGLDVKKILLSIGPSPEDRQKGRWFIFAAGSGEAFGLNLIRDRQRKELRRAGWSVEKIAEFGKAQVGVGWRKGPTQVSLAASRREIGVHGYSEEDTVVGVTVSIKP